jgi:hypothetical protein
MKRDVIHGTSNAQEQEEMCVENFLSVNLEKKKNHFGDLCVDES